MSSIWLSQDGREVAFEREGMSQANVSAENGLALFLEW